MISMKKGYKNACEERNLRVLDHVLFHANFPIIILFLYRENG